MTSVRGLLVVFITSLTCNLTKSLNHKTLPEQKCDNEQSKCSAKPIKSIQITDSYVLDMMEYGAKLELLSKVHQLEATVNKMENKMSKRASRPFAIVNYLPDSALVASNSHNNDHLPIYGRIGSTHIPGKSHAWCIKAMGDYLTIDLQ
eukprot:1160718_1